MAYDRFHHGRAHSISQQAYAISPATEGEFEGIIETHGTLQFRNLQHAPARAARGQINSHNSMLIHVSRFKDVHQKVFGQVDEWLANLKRVLKFRTGGDKLVTRLEHLWSNDFQGTSVAVCQSEIGQGLAPLTWNQVDRELAKAADKIRVQVVNSEMRDAIDYEGNAEKGLSVIAVGGDKLSRGLTLEGLTVSYFLRASKMYDSLMQMGRWFGYRPGYVDLCRLYLTPDLELWFRHVATAAEELRERLNHMAMLGSTPESYGLRIQSHEILLVTAQSKMRNAPEFQISFQGESKIQTVFFNDEASNWRNSQTATSFLNKLGKPSEPDSDKDEYKSSQDRRVWKNVKGIEVAALLGGLLFPEEARDVNSVRLASYIREQLASGELTDWTVAILAGDGVPLEVGEWTFRTIQRKAIPRGADSGRYVVKTILSPRDEAIDLSKEEYDRALAATNRKREAEGQEPKNASDGPEIRKTRGENPKRALLLLYPLSPEAVQPTFAVPIFGVVVSFPDSRNGRAVRYRFNTVEQRLEPA